MLTLGYLACHVTATARGKQDPACVRNIAHTLLFSATLIVCLAKRVTKNSKH